MLQYNKKNTSDKTFYPNFSINAKCDADVEARVSAIAFSYYRVGELTVNVPVIAISMLIYATARLSSALIFSCK